MRNVVWFILLFVGAAVTASTLGTNDGLVSFYWGGWRMDVSMNLFLLVLVASCFALMSIMQAAKALVGLPQRAHEWRLSQRDRIAQAMLRDSISQYFGGRYSRAHKAAQRALLIQAGTPELLHDIEFTVLGHLLSAVSMHRLQDHVGRDEQLQRAIELCSRNMLVRPAEEGARLLAAEWALDDRDAPRALDLLNALPPGVARRTHALRLKLQASRLALKPYEALRTARLLAKHQAFSKAAAQGLLRSLAFESVDGTCDGDQVRQVWSALESADRRDPLVAARAAARMAAFGAHAEARAWLRPFWDAITDLSADERAAVSEALVAALAGIGLDWLSCLEFATRIHPWDSAVSYAVGCALAERELWGKARVLLEQAASATDLSTKSRRHAWLVLARMAERQSDAERVAACYQAAAKMSE